jgi:hypothetical protein
MSRQRTSWAGALWTALIVAGVAAAGIGAAVLALLISVFTQSSPCGSPAPAAGEPVVGGPAGGGRLVGATEFGGPGDPRTGTVGAIGVSLLDHPDSYAELGGYTVQTATAMGGLPWMTPLRITWASHSAIAYKRDLGLGGPPVDGLPRAIDLWWEFAGRLGIPYEDGRWSGPVRIERPPDTGAANVLGQTPAGLGAAATGDVAACMPQLLGGVPISAGPRALLLRDGLASAPAAAPAAIKEIIAAGDQIVGKPYLYGGGHGLPLDEIAGAYDCSSSVEHLLYGARLLPVTYDAPSGDLASFGEPGPGRWVTLYANAEHVFMYVAGLRWDTHDAAGPRDGSGGIGWHPLVRSSAGFVARHPGGL